MEESASLGGGLSCDDGAPLSTLPALTLPLLAPRGVMAASRSSDDDEMSAASKSKKGRREGGLQARHRGKRDITMHGDEAAGGARWVGGQRAHAQIPWM